MPPNTGSECVLSKRKKAVERIQSDEDERGSDAGRSDDGRSEEKKNSLLYTSNHHNQKASSTLPFNCFKARSLVVLLGVTTVFTIGFFYLPWEEWILSEEEWQVYLSEIAAEEAGIAAAEEEVSKVLELAQEDFNLDPDGVSDDVSGLDSASSSSSSASGCRSTEDPNSDSGPVEGQYYNFLATTEQHFSQISLHEVNCSVKGYHREASIGGQPVRCGTLIFDDLLSSDEVLRLRKLAGKLIDRIGDSSSYIRESLNLKWVNLHNVFRKGPGLKIFNEKDYDLLKKTGNAIKQTVCATFGLHEELVFFSNVSQFTRHKPVTQFSEFLHVDKVRSPSLIVTTIFWLSTVDVDFSGGRLEFLTGGPEPFSPLLIEPKQGRLAAWTSSYENPHGVQEMFDGERYALIFAFTASSIVGHETLDDLRHWAVSFDELNIR